MNLYDNLLFTDQTGSIAGGVVAVAVLLIVLIAVVIVVIVIKVCWPLRSIAYTYTWKTASRVALSM